MSGSLDFVGHYPTNRAIDRIVRWDRSELKYDVTLYFCRPEWVYRPSADGQLLIYDPLSPFKLQERPLSPALPIGMPVEPYRGGYYIYKAEIGRYEAEFNVVLGVIEGQVGFVRLDAVGHDLDVHLDTDVDFSYHDHETYVGWGESSCNKIARSRNVKVRDGADVLTRDLVRFPELPLWDGNVDNLIWTTKLMHLSVTDTPYRIVKPSEGLLSLGVDHDSNYPLFRRQYGREYGDSDGKTRLYLLIKDSGPLGLDYWVELDQIEPA